MNRLETLPLPPKRYWGVILGAFVALVYGVFILRGTYSLDTQWLVISLILLSAPWVVLLFRDLEYLLLGLFVLLMPLRIDMHFTYDPSTSSAKGLSLTATDLVLISLYAFWILRTLTTRNSTTSRRLQWGGFWVNFAYWGMVLWGILSMTVAINPVFSFYEVSRFIKLYLGFFYLINNVRTEGHWKAICIALCLAVFLEGVIACIQYFVGGALNLGLFGETRHSYIVQEIGEGELARVAGTLGHPNGLAFYLMVMLPVLTIFMMAFKSIWMKFITMAALAAGLIAIILTFSRMGWLATASILPFVVFMGAWKERGLPFALKSLGIVLILFTLCVIPLIQPIAQRLGGDDYGRAYSRIPLMKVAVNIIKANPFIGVGLNHYTLRMEEYDNTLEKISLHVPNPVHNTYLFIAAETGIPGLVFFLTLLGTLMIRGWRGFCRFKGFPALISIGAVGAIASHCIHGLVSFNALGATYYFALFMAMATIPGILDERTQTNR